MKKLQRADLLCAHARAHWVTISNLEKLTNWMSIFEISLLKVTGDADYGMFFLGQILECCVDKLNWMSNLCYAGVQD